MLTEEHLCPACGVPMALRLRREVEGYDIPEEGHALDVFGMFRTVTLYLDLYTCPQCRRAEFYEADLAPEPEELEYLVISVDVLGEPEKISSPEELDTEQYGVIVTRGHKRGLLLPNLEGIDTVEEQIAIAKQKAGIRENEEVGLERFEVIRHV